MKKFVRDRNRDLDSEPNYKFRNEYIFCGFYVVNQPERKKIKWCLL